MAAPARGHVSDTPLEGEQPADDRVQLATVELLGAVTYGQLRAFQTTATAIAVAPDARSADMLADHAMREHRAYVTLRDHLVAETDLAAAVIDRQKPVFDAYFDAVPLDDWRSACVFFTVGLPIAADFSREVAPTLQARTAEVIVAALADRGPSRTGPWSSCRRRCRPTRTWRPSGTWSPTCWGVR